MIKPKANKDITFSMDDVRKGIMVFAEKLHDLTEHMNPDDYDIIYSNHTDTEKSSADAANNAAQMPVVSNQQLINTYLALSKAEVKPYNETPFVAQLFAQTKEDKQAIDSVRKELTQFIMKRSHYPHLKLEIFTSDPSAKKISVYSPVDKFVFLKEQSPAIELLKENFKCEIKY